MISVKRTRRINTGRVLRAIWLNRGISRTEIARVLDLDKSTVSNIVSDLLKRGAVTAIAEGQAGPQGGRRPIHLTINRDFGCVLGFELRPDYYTAVAVNLEGRELFSKTERICLSGANLIGVFFDLFKRTEEELARTDLPLLGIGVGIPGVVDPSTGRISYSIPLKLDHSLDFLGQVSEAMGVPVLVDNDAKCCSWGELTFHREKRLKNFLFALIEFRKNEEIAPPSNEIAVGLSFVIGGRVHYGDTCSAGEFKSILWQEGNLGQFSLTDDEMHRLEGDGALASRFIEEFSRHVALFVNSLNLNQVFLGGDIEGYRTEFYRVLTREIQRNWAYPSRVDCAVSFSSLGDKAVAYGAAGMLLDHLFFDGEFSPPRGRLDLFQAYKWETSLS